MRQAVSPVLSTVMLIAISVSIAVIVSTHYMGISYDSLDCEILSAQIFEISETNFWGEVKFFNSGDYTIDEYSIVIYDDLEETTFDIPDSNISPKEITVQDFEITQNLSSENILLMIAINSQDSKSQCMMDVKI